jgi:hypothetical protein
MTTHRRKPTPAIAWKFENQRKVDWPSWVTDYEVSTVMGAGKIGLSSVGTLIVPTQNTYGTPGLSGDYLVWEGYAEDASGKLVGGSITLVKGQDFPLRYEAVEPAAEG